MYFTLGLGSMMMYLRYGYNLIKLGLLTMNLWSQPEPFILSLILMEI